MTEVPNISRHWGPERSLVSVMSASLRDSDIAVSGDLGAVYPYRLYYPCDGCVRMGVANLRA